MDEDSYQGKLATSKYTDLVPGEMGETERARGEYWGRGG